MNVGTRAATILLEASSADDGDAIRMEVRDVPPMRTALFWPGCRGSGDWGDRSQAYASATLTSDQPIVAVVNDGSLHGTMDGAIDVGVPLGDPGGP